ncbi:MAG: ribonuclease H1 domain-containing protein [Planctomycetota bacterium]|jgi:ribonuclease HI
MASPEKKFYVVWKGTTPGVYTTWAECESVIKGHSNARYKSFPTLESAEKAFREGPDDYWGSNKFVSPLSDTELAAIGQPITSSMCVDAAWNTETKTMEYRGVWYHDRSIAFQRGPFENATNNIGEFLAIVHALALMAKRSIDWPIYSDSQTAISWVRKKRVRSKSMEEGETGEQINDLVAKALRWLNENEYPNDVLKWETKAWGEVPADFGRK